MFRWPSNASPKVVFKIAHWGCHNILTKTCTESLLSFKINFALSNSTQREHCESFNIGRRFSYLLSMWVNSTASLQRNAINNLSPTCTKLSKVKLLRKSLKDPDNNRLIIQWQSNITLCPMWLRDGGETDHVLQTPGCPKSSLHVASESIVTKHIKATLLKTEIFGTWQKAKTMHNIALLSQYGFLVFFGHWSK